MKKMIGLAALALTALLAATPAAAADGCDRACLKSTLDQFLNAVTHHDPAAAPLAADFRATENAVVTPVGQGLWSSATGLGEVQRRYLDPEAGQAAYFGLVNEAAGPAVVSLRLKVEHRKIVEAEWIVARKGMALYSPPGLIALPPAEGPAVGDAGMSRDQLIAVAQSYFNALEAHDGGVMMHNPGCTRVENGTRVTGHATAPPPGADSSAPPIAREFGFADCADKLAGGKDQLAGVAHRHVAAADVEQGVVGLTGIFERPPGAVRRDGSPNPRLLLTEYFRIENGKIQTVHAAMSYLPADAPDTTGWAP